MTVAICGHFTCAQPDTVAHAHWLCAEYNHACACGSAFGDHVSNPNVRAQEPQQIANCHVCGMVAAVGWVKAEDGRFTPTCLGCFYRRRKVAR